MLARARLGPWALGAGLAGALALGGGCVTKTGGAWTSDAEPEPARVSAIVLGDAQEGAATRAVARHLQTGGPDAPSFALWMGSAADNERDCKRLRKRGEALAELEAQLEGIPVYAVQSPANWRCNIELPKSFVHPAANFVVDLSATGDSAVVSTCDAQGCKVTKPAPSVLARLVFVDESPWAFPQLDHSARSAATQAQLVALLEALPPALETPHLLVTHLPIESSGSHGQGGWDVTSTFIHHPQIVKAAIAGGRFDGVIAGHEGNLQLNRDLTDAVKRSSRVWLRRPLFQVVVGSSGDPDLRHPGPRMRPRWQGIALRPDHSSPHAGFARLDFAADTIRATLHAKHGGRWQRTRAAFSLLRPAHPTEAPAPSFVPCRDCDPREGAADHGRWFPERRGEGTPPPNATAVAPEGQPPTRSEGASD